MNKGKETGKKETHIPEHVPIHADELRKLAVRLVDLARAAPEARGDAHRAEHAVVIEQQPLERLLDEHQVLRVLKTSADTRRQRRRRREGSETHDVGEGLRLGDRLCVP